MFDSPFMVKAHENKKCTLFTDKVQDKKVQESIASQNSKYELDWKFRYEKGVDEFYNTYTECGICKLGKRENCFEFVPCLCNLTCGFAMHLQFRVDLSNMDSTRSHLTSVSLI